MMILRILSVLAACTLSMHAAAAPLRGDQLSLLWGIPFAGILLSIALAPLFISRIWHHHYGKITLLWVLLFLLPFLSLFGLSATGALLAHTVIEEFVPFILLLLALFTVSGGILIQGNLTGSPNVNVTMLAIGTVLASVMGTTGAAMLLIRPLPPANDQRRHQVHIMVFFIFLVANIGGGLTPLGDPPLFIGFLKGVDFLWTAQHMLLPVVIAAALLLGVFYLIDFYYYRKEDELTLPDPTPATPRLTIQGKSNFILLLAIIGVVLGSGMWQTSPIITLGGVEQPLAHLCRDAALLVITALSLYITPKRIRSENQFDWQPIIEVAKLFAGIFITIYPVIVILKAGSSGALSGLVALVSDASGEPINAMYFWLTGALSSFLDNAPTYLVFFNLASGDAAELMGPLQTTLLAISVGSVFMGAVTYIGNAPNFMVRSIAISHHIAMPSFFGYMKWSLVILLPIFALLTLLLFR